MYFFDVFCFKDYFGGWVFQEQSFNSFADIDGFANENVNGEEFEVLVKCDVDGCVFVIWYSVNFSRNIIFFYYRVELYCDKRIIMFFLLNLSVFFCIQE